MVHGPWSSQIELSRIFLSEEVRFFRLYGTPASGLAKLIATAMWFEVFAFWLPIFWGFRAPRNVPFLQFLAVSPLRAWAARKRRHPRRLEMLLPVTPLHRKAPQFAMVAPWGPGSSPSAPSLNTAPNTEKCLCSSVLGSVEHVKVQ